MNYTLRAWFAGLGKDDERMKKSKHSSLLALVLIVALLISLMSGMALATSGTEIDFRKPIDPILRCRSARI